MPIPDPWTRPDEASEEVGSPTNGVHEPAPVHERARVYRQTEESQGHAEVLKFPRSADPRTCGDEPREITMVEAKLPEKLLSVSTAWWTDVRRTASAAADGAIWRARPPSLRDIHARIERAEWAGDLRWLHRAGVAFGYVALAVTALGYALLWVARRPSRVVTAGLIATVVVFLAL